MRRIGTHEARRLLDAGAQFVEVLPEVDFRTEHLPGAVSIPLPEMTPEAVSDLDPTRPTVVYCYDLQCDLSARGAARLERMGFVDVHDFAGSKAAWLAMGWESEGSRHTSEHAVAAAVDAATCLPDTPLAKLPAPGPGGVVVVVDEDDTVLGSIDPAHVGDVDSDAFTAFDVAAPGPPTVRPSISVDELARSMDRADESHVIVTTLEGTLMGIVERSALRVDR